MPLICSKICLFEQYTAWDCTLSKFTNLEGDFTRMKKIQVTS